MIGENKQLRFGAPTFGGNGTMDFRVSTYYIDSMVSVITFAREAINSVIFELFVRSVNHANTRKLNSFVIFIVNLKELRTKY